MDYVLKPLGIFARAVYCVGRNYAAHAKELGNAVPTEPVIFLKPTSSLSRTGWQIVRPPQSKRIDHEVEVVVVMGGGGKNIREENAMDFVSGFAVGIDVTARDLQEEAKKKGLPWAVAKGFDTFAPVSDIVPKAECAEGPWDFSLSVNGQMRQKATTADMLFPIPRLIHYLSTLFTLSPGDLIFTGTPEGVGPLQPGDKVVAEAFKGKARLELKVE